MSVHSHVSVHSCMLMYHMYIHMCVYTCTYGHCPFICVCMHMKAQGWGQESSSIVLPLYSLKQGFLVKNPELANETNLWIPLSLTSKERKLGPHPYLTFYMGYGDPNDGPLFEQKEINHWTIPPNHKVLVFKGNALICPGVFAFIRNYQHERIPSGQIFKDFLGDNILSDTIN